MPESTYLDELLSSARIYSESALLARRSKLIFDSSFTIVDDGESLTFSASGGGGGDATSLQGVGISAVAPIAGQVLTYVGSAWTAVDPAGGSPGGSTTQVQYNSSGSFAGSSSLTFDGTSLTAGGLKSPSLDAIGAGDALAIAGTNALTLALGKSGRATTVLGSLTVNEAATFVSMAFGGAPASAGYIRFPHSTGDTLLAVHDNASGDWNIIKKISAGGLRFGDANLTTELIAYSTVLYALSGAITLDTNSSIEFGDFSVGNPHVTIVTTSATNTSITFGALMTAPQIIQAAAASGTGANTLVQAQKGGAAAAGGDLKIGGGDGGAGGGANGLVDFINASFTTTPPSAGGVVIPVTCTGFASIKVGGTTRQIMLF